MKPIKALPVLILLLPLLVIGQTKQIDSLKNLVGEGQATAEVLEKICFYFFAASKQDSIPKYLEKFKKAIEGNNTRYQGLVDFYDAQIFFPKDTADFFNHSNTALTSAKKLKCAECIALNYLGMALKNRRYQYYELSITQLQNGLSAISKIEGIRIIEIRGMIYAALSSSYHQSGKLTEGLQYGLDALRIAEMQNDLILKNKVYTALSAVYGDLSSSNNKLGTENDRKRYNQLTKNYMIKSYESSVMLNNKRLAGTSAYNLGMFYGDELMPDSSSYYLNIAINKGLDTKYWELVSNAYNIIAINFAETNPDTAILLFDKSYEYGKLANLMRNQASALLSKATVFQMKGKLKEAIRLAEEGLALSLKIERKISRLNAYKILTELNEEAGNVAKAYYYLKKNIEVKDSLVNEENYARIEELKTQYDVELKDKEIKNLAQMASIQALEIRQRNWIVVSLALFIVMASVGFWLFVRQRTLKQKQIVMEAEQRLNRARMNPHFFFNALSSLQQHALRQTDGLVLASRLSQFSDVMRKTLESTYMEYTTIEEEVAFLGQYLEIQKNRYPVAFNFNIECAPDLDIHEMLIPPMIIQPFVENSIEHGLAGIDWPGDVLIRFSTVDEELFVEVVDNGKGLGNEKQDKNDHISRATEIIRDRIYLLATKVKSKARFSVGPNPTGSGVRVAIYLPILFAESQLVKQG